MSNNIIKKFIGHCKETYMNKLVGIGLIFAGGILPLMLTGDNDITALVFCMLIGIPMIFLKKNVFDENNYEEEES